MPQPTQQRRTEPEAPPAPTEDATNGGGKTDREKAKAAKAAAVAALTELASQDTESSRQIKRAILLEQHRAEHQEQIDDNRLYLRLMAKNGTLNETEVAWLNVFHPVKAKDERRSKDEVEATRIAKEVARAVKFQEATS